VCPPAVNGRFGEIAALAPQKRQCDFGSYYPAGTFVKPLPRQAAGTVVCNASGAVFKRIVDDFG